ncbi:MAG TPA: MoaD/ThiS family protein [Anaerolineae bacterium]|nr:MoaD/ThiS family protein [Anaerolineae bacterium]
MEKVQVTAVGLLRATLPGKTAVEPGQTVAQVVSALGLTTGEGIIPLVNGALASWSTLLHEGDRLELVQSVGGGA